MSNGKFPVLIFKNSGWCEELKCSYFAGRYEARTKEQYEALKKYAEDEVRAPEEKSLEEMTVKELRAKAAPLGVADYANLKKVDLIKAIEEAEAEDEARATEDDDAPEAPEDDINIEAAE